MSGLAVGGALALVAAFWVLGPILRPSAPSGDGRPDREPGASEESDSRLACNACGAELEPDARFCAQCGRRRTT